ncbi:hypothetical protein D3C86_1512260 [compost metagenome]
MALTLEQQVRLLYGDTTTSPFYPLLTSDEVLWFLEQNSNNVQNAARQAAIAASFQLAGWSTRERTGNIEVWNNLANSYMKALDNFISQKVTTLPSGLLPYCAGISWSDVEANNANLDNVRPALTQISLCDNEESITF